MSSRAARLLAVALLAAAPSTRLAAQSPAPRSPEDVARHIEALVPRVREARIAAEEARAGQRAREALEDHPKVDTIAVGPVQVVVPPDQVELATGLFGEVWRETFANVTESPGLERRYFTFQWRVAPEPIYMPSDPGDPPVSRVELRRLQDRTRDAVKRHIQFEIARALVEDFDHASELGKWLTGVHRNDLDPAAAYHQLALAASLGGPFAACLSGDAGACWTMNGLDWPDPAAALADAFTTEEKVAVTRRGVAMLPEPMRRRLETFPDGPEILSCLDRQTEEACRHVLGDETAWILRDVMGDRQNALRWTLFWHAVAVGGVGAWQRALAHADSPPGEALVEVSGLDRGALTASWLATVEEHRASRATLGDGRWMVFFWVLAFAALALRSTRWRMG